MADWDFDTMEAGNRPSQKAWQQFFRAEDLAGSAARTNPDKDGSVKNILYYMALSQAAIAIGLKELSVGVRATYILLDKIDKKLGR